MSRYEWESGTIKLPSKEYNGFKKDIMTAWNNLQMQLLAQAAKLREWCKKHKVKATDDIGFKIWEVVKYETKAILGDYEEHELTRLIIKDGKFQSPKKKDLDLKGIRSFTGCSFEEASITFSDKSKTVTWHVEENNHACETARDHHMGQVFFRRLGQVNWTRGSGGKIIGNDEYNRDCGGEYEGGGGSYCKTEYGPNKQKTRSYAGASYAGPGNNGWGSRFF